MDTYDTVTMLVRYDGTVYVSDPRPSHRGESSSLRRAAVPLLTRRQERYLCEFDFEFAVAADDSAHCEQSMHEPKPRLCEKCWHPLSARQRCAHELRFWVPGGDARQKALASGPSDHLQQAPLDATFSKPRAEGVTKACCHS